MLPPDWQRQMIEMIRGAAPLDDAWFAGGPTLTPMDQIGVYKDQYRMRLYDALEVEVPGLGRLLGDDLETVLRAYLADNPSRSWTLNHVADRLGDWLEVQGAPVEQVDMARLDRAVMAGFEAAEPVPLTPEDAAPDVALVLAPPVTCLRLRTDVQRMRAQVIADLPSEPVVAADLPLVVFRRGIRMRHQVLDLPAWLLLTQFTAPCTLHEALPRLLSEGVDTQEVAAGVSRWFQSYAELGLLQRA